MYFTLFNYLGVHEVNLFLRFNRFVLFKDRVYLSLIFLFYLGACTNLLQTSNVFPCPISFELFAQ